MIEQVMNVGILMLLQADETWSRSGSDMQEVWLPVIDFLQPLLISSAGLGLTVGVIYKLTEDDDSDRHGRINTVMGASISGLLLGLLSVPITTVILNWF